MPPFFVYLNFKCAFIVLQLLFKINENMIQFLHGFSFPVSFTPISPLLILSTVAANTTSPAPSRSIFLLNSFVTFKLSHTIFCAWECHVTPHLSGIQVMGHIDGTIPSQSSTIIQGATSISFTPNTLHGSPL